MFFVRLLITIFVILILKHNLCTSFEFDLSKVLNLDPSVSYGELGSFERDGEMKHIGFLPAAPEQIGTTFYYQASQSQQFRLNYSRPGSMKKVKENSTIAIIVHGYHSSASDPLIVKLRDSILNFTKINATILVDWQNGANSLNYFQSVSNSQLVGRQIALLVERLRKYRKINPKDVHLIGFSLGAHLVGFSGRWAKKKYNFMFGRISALDAAMYLFENYRIHVRRGDAMFVDAIHSSAGTNVMNNEYGSLKPFADIDFYPNGGSEQPQCEESPDRMCNHLAALVYYQTSIKYTKSCEYLSVSCNSYRHFLKKDCRLTSISRMGFYANTYPARGKHYLQTTAPFPHKSPKPSKDLFYYPSKVFDDVKSIISFKSDTSSVISDKGTIKATPEVVPAKKVEKNVIKPSVLRTTLIPEKETIKSSVQKTTVYKETTTKPSVFFSKVTSTVYKETTKPSVLVPKVTSMPEKTTKHLVTKTTKLAEKDKTTKPLVPKTTTEAEKETTTQVSVVKSNEALKVTSVVSETDDTENGEKIEQRTEEKSQEQETDTSDELQIIQSNESEEKEEL